MSQNVAVKNAKLLAFSAQKLLFPLATKMMASDSKSNAEIDGQCATIANSSRGIDLELLLYFVLAVEMNQY